MYRINEEDLAEIVAEMRAHEGRHVVLIGAWADRIDPPVKVGSVVSNKFSAMQALVLAVDDDQVWVRTEGGMRDTWPLGDTILESPEGAPQAPSAALPVTPPPYVAEPDADAGGDDQDGGPEE